MRNRSAFILGLLAAALSSSGVYAGKDPCATALESVGDAMDSYVRLFDYGLRERQIPVEKLHEALRANAPLNPLQDVALTSKNTSLMQSFRSLIEKTHSPEEWTKARAKLRALARELKVEVKETETAREKTKSTTYAEGVRALHYDRHHLTAHGWHRDAKDRILLTAIAEMPGGSRYLVYAPLESGEPIADVAGDWNPIVSEISWFETKKGEVLLASYLNGKRRGRVRVRSVAKNLETVFEATDTPREMRGRPEWYRTRKGKTFLAVHGDGEIFIYEPLSKKNKPLYRLKNLDDEMARMQWYENPKGELFLIVRSANDIAIYQPEKDIYPFYKRPLRATLDMAKASAIELGAPGGDLWATADDNYAYVHDLGAYPMQIWMSEQKVATLKNIDWIALPDGRRLLLVHREGELQLFEPQPDGSMERPIWSYSVPPPYYSMSPPSWMVTPDGQLHISFTERGASGADELLAYQPLKDNLPGLRVRLAEQVSLAGPYLSVSDETDTMVIAQAAPGANPGSRTMNFYTPDVGTPFTTGVPIGSQALHYHGLQMGHGKEVLAVSTSDNGIVILKIGGEK